MPAESSTLGAGAERTPWSVVSGVVPVDAPVDTDGVFGTRRAHALVACSAALVVLVAVGCAGTTGSEDGTGGVRTAEIAAASGDRALAARINLVLDDLPGGWSQLPTDTNPIDELWNCLRPARSRRTVTADVTSHRFGRGPMRIAVSQTTIFATPEEAASAFERASADDLGQCIAMRVGSARRPGDQPRLAEIRADELAFPSLGEGSVAYRVTGTVEARGATWNWFLDLVLVQRDRALAVLIAGDAPAPFPAKLERRLARIIEARMEPGAVAL